MRWLASKVLPGVTFAVRRITLGQRIALTEQARELSLKHDFLKAGDASDQLEASLSELLVKKLYLDWGLAEIAGLSIDGHTVEPAACGDLAPEALAEEIVAAVQAELGLNEEERKNS